VVRSAKIGIDQPFGDLDSLLLEQEADSYEKTWGGEGYRGAEGRLDHWPLLLRHFG
jgi:hypothetical protein